MKRSLTLITPNTDEGHDPRRGPHAGSPRGVLGNHTKLRQSHFVLVRVISWIVSALPFAQSTRNWEMRIKPMNH